VIRTGNRRRNPVRSTRRGNDHTAGSPGGTAITLPGITILHFRGDRVIERFSQADMLGLLIQVGAVPAPA
jgi:hypothetical protein